MASAETLRSASSPLLGASASFHSRSTSAGEHTVRALTAYSSSPELEELFNLIEIAYIAESCWRVLREVRAKAISRTPSSIVPGKQLRSRSARASARTPQPQVRVRNGRRSNSAIPSRSSYVSSIAQERDGINASVGQTIRFIEPLALRHHDSVLPLRSCVPIQRSDSEPASSVTCIRASVG